MARWKLMTSHYLDCRDTAWEYKLTDRATGRQVRKEMAVPRYLDINDPGDWTNKFGSDSGVSRGGSAPDGQGDIVVCYKDKGEPRDIIFYGDPTPDMTPLDDEAAAISASFAEKWRYKPESAEISFSQSMVDRLEIEKAAIETAPQKVEIAGLTELVALMAQQLQQNQDLMKTLQPRKL